MHARASTRFLTGVPPKRTDSAEIHAGVSMDQIARAAARASDTQLASLELALEGRDFAGACDAGYSCAYTNTIAWRGADDAAADGEQPARRLRAAVRRQRQHRSRRRGSRRIATDRSILDSVTERGRDAAAARSAPRDRAKLDRVPRRGARRRAAHPEGRGAERPRAAASSSSRRGIPASVRRARQADVRPAGARVSDRPDARHHVHDGARAQRPDLSRRSACPRRIIRCRTISNDPAKLAKLAKINAYHATLFAYYLEKLRRRRTATARCSIT